MNNYQLDKHMVIEASAGTGKTYTITKIIAKIIRENAANPENIVVVTYTEKAAGELKDRIFKEFKDSFEDSTDPVEKMRFENGIKNIDEMMISTIHGFCNSLISEFAFENGEQFQSTIADDSVLLPKILHTYMRKKWFDIYDGTLPDLLKISGFSDKPEDFENTVIKIANNIYSLADSDTLKFTPDKMTPEEMKNKYKEAIVMIGNLKGYRESIKASSVLEVSTAIIVGIKNAILKPISSILHTDADDVSILELIASLNSQIKELKKRINLKRPSKEETDEDREIYKIIVDISTVLNQITGGLIINTALELVREVRQHKKEAGLISFNDMLVLVDNALRNNPDFLKHLGKKYKFGLVDEFQDTDSVQWSIFKQLFLESHTNNKLFVIGDPKQAIYAFRNADIFTYFKAVRQILDENHGVKFVLDTNYRSTQCVVDGYNKMFAADNFFINKDIIYENVNHCPPEKIKVLPDKPELGVNIYKMAVTEGRKRIVTFRKEYVEFMIEEIKKILSGNSIRLQKNGSGEFSIPDEGDICILTSKNKDSILLEKMLREHGIKTTIYKKAGLYQSDEAKSLFLLFDALTQMNSRGKYKKVLMSDFFGISASDIEKYDFEELENIAYDYMTELKVLADKREWIEFFNRILERTAIIYRTIKEHPESAERKSANYYQLSELLEDQVFTNRLDLRGLRDYLHSLINSVVKAEMETDLHRLETEDKKVQIMTIHTSKGLEFPIVFIYGALNSPNSKNSSYWTYHDDDKYIVYDVLKDDKEMLSETESIKERFDSERSEELRRLFYVAITRAQAMIYIPIIEKCQKKNEGKNGKISTEFKGSTDPTCPAETFLYDAVMQNDSVIEGVTLYTKDIAEKYKTKDNGEENEGFIKNKNDNNRSYFMGNVEIDERKPLFYNLKPEDFERFFTIQSYTSIDRKSRFDRKDENGASHFEYESLAKRKKNETYTENDSGEIEVAELPSGSVTGNLLHAILEKIDYTKDVTATDEVIVRSVERYYGEKRKEVKEQFCKLSASIINSVLNTILPEINIKIKDLTLENRKNEMEFYLKLDDEGQCFINGFIDMVYRYNGKYYILDWKSNRLNSYRGKQFIDDVRKHYELQYNIYHLAVVDWLKSVFKERFDYEKDFGGIVYIYMRGLAVENDGVFFEKGDYEHYLSLRESLSDTAAKCGFIKVK